MIKLQELSLCWLLLERTSPPIAPLMPKKALQKGFVYQHNLTIFVKSFLLSPQILIKYAKGKLFFLTILQSPDFLYRIK